VLVGKAKGGAGRNAANSSAKSVSAVVEKEAEWGGRAGTAGLPTVEIVEGLVHE
jgi:hypothetical protein